MGGEQQVSLIFRIHIWIIPILIILLLSSDILLSAPLQTAENASLKRQFSRAVAANDLETVKELLIRGVDPDIGFGYSPLISVVKTADKRSDMIALLLEYGANINPVKGETPLHNVHSIDVARQLIEAGANIDATTPFTGTTPLIRALFWHDQFLRFNASSQNRKPPKKALEYAKIANFLLESGADPNINSESGTALHVVTGKSGDTRLIEALIAHGANLNAKRKGRSPNMRIYGATPLMEAVYYLDIEKVRVLLNHGADIYAGPKNCSAFCALAKIRKNLYREKPGSISLDRLQKVEALLLQYSPDRLAKIKLKITKLFEFSTKFKLLFAIVAFYAIFSAAYISIIKVLIECNLVKTMLLSMLLIPVEILFASWTMDKISQGMDLAYAGAGVLVILIISVIAGSLVGLVFIPLIAKFTANNKAVPS